MNKKVCIWVHGVQGEKLDSKAIYDCISSVNKLTSGGIDHVVFNWDQYINDIESKTWESVKSKGNWLTRKILYPMCFIGLDMILYLMTLKGAMYSEHREKIQSELRNMIDVLATIYKEAGIENIEITFVAHSFGNKVSLDYIIDHPEKNFNFISMGSPLAYFSCVYPDWGNPSLITNVKNWINLVIDNDPIAWEFNSNQGKFKGQWKEKVKDIKIFSWHILPIKSHTSYWKSSNVHKLIAESLTENKH